MSLPRVSILRQGEVYKSLDVITIKDPVTQEPVAEVDMANPGLIRRDLLRNTERSFRSFQDLSCADLIEISKKAGDLFMNAELPLFGDEQTQSPEDYLICLAATSGLPHALIRKNMTKIFQVFTEMQEILKGLTRGMPLDIIDEGMGLHGGVTVSYFPRAKSLGIVLPSNSPGVNSLWMPAVILKSPVILKPGREEPWTPCRIMQAFIQAGVPKEAFSFYPTNHEGSSQIMDCCKRSMIFGGQDTVERYGDNPNVEVHGPGWSKILIGNDQIEDYQDFIDLIVESVSLNSGRSCINASAVVVPKHGKKIAEALAAELVQIKPTAIDDPHARLSSFANPKFAEFINAAIEEDLKTPGAVDCTAEARGTSNRLVIHNGRTYLLPSVIYCDSPDHPIYNKEYLFPFVTVVESEQKDFFNIIGQSLIVSGITEDESLSRELLECPLIDRLNIGPIPTTRLDWDQPHEGNLFEFLYKRRAIQRTHTER